MWRKKGNYDKSLGYKYNLILDYLTVRILCLIFIDLNLFSTIFQEYLPILNKYKSMPADYMKYSIDTDLKRYPSALNHIAKCPDNFQECLKLIQVCIHFFESGSIILVWECHVPPTQVCSLKPKFDNFQTSLKIMKGSSKLLRYISSFAL